MAARRVEDLRRQIIVKRSELHELEGHRDQATEDLSNELDILAELEGSL